MPPAIEQTPSEHVHPRRKGAVTCVILHSTGSTDVDRVHKYYRTSSSGVCPHFLVLPDGSIRQYVPLDHVAYHVGFSADDAKIYGGGPQVWTLRQGGQVLPAPYAGYDEWLARWPGRKSPLDLPSGASPNGRSVGIELLCERGMCTPAQYESLAELLRRVSSETGLTLSRENVIGHYDADPMARASSRGGTDPGPYFEWDRVWKGL